MRLVAGAAIVLICGAAAAAARAGDPPSSATVPVLALTPTSVGPDDDGVSALLARATPLADAASVDWRGGEMRFAPQAALRVRIGEPPAGARTLQPPGYSGAQAYELSLVRDWPGAVSFNTEHFGVDLTPHAGVGMTSYGGLAEAGATLKVSQRVSDAVKSKLNAMGVRDGKQLGDRGRWYLFAAASGRSVGLNMLRGDAGWARAGWTTDQTSTLVGDAQVGVGWRKGDMQTSLGLVHRELKGLRTLYGIDEPKGDSLVAFSFSVRPEK